MASNHGVVYLRPGKVEVQSIDYPELKTPQGKKIDHGVISSKGHRLDSRQRESSLNQLLTAESTPLRCPQIEENARACALFSSFLQRTRKSRTGWRMVQSDANRSLASNSLIIRENTGNFHDFGCPEVDLNGRKPCLL